MLSVVFKTSFLFFEAEFSRFANNALSFYYLPQPLLTNNEGSELPDG